MKDRLSPPEATSIVAFMLSEMLLNLLVIKSVITLEEAKDLLLRLSSRIDAESTRARESGKSFQASAFKDMEDLLIHALEMLDSTHRTKSG
jgi:hypothetical protein